MVDFISVIARVKGALERMGHEITRGRDEWLNTTCPVPSHQDNRPSFGFKPDGPGVVFNCFGGCDRAMILEALGLTEADVSGIKKKREKEELGPVVAEYEYTDERGRLLFKINRHEPKTFRPWHRKTDGTWASGFGPSGPVLFNLPRVVEAASKKDLILVVEGEKDALTAGRLGFVATTCPMGASSWRPEMALAFRGALLVSVPPDNDDPGRKYAEEIVGACRTQRIPIKVVNLPGLEEHGDLSDWVAAGGDAATLRKLIDEAPRADFDLAEIELAARPLLEMDDPIPAYRAAIASRFGGDTRPAETVLLCATTRVLAQPKGAMPGNVHVKGVASSGKNAATDAALELLPSEDVAVFDATSPKAFIYDRQSTVHCVVYFKEASSIPIDPENPATSLLRTVLQDGKAKYTTVEKDEHGRMATRQIVKEGPITLVSTGTMSFEDQLASRVLEIEMADDRKQLHASLLKMADLELDGLEPVDPALVAYQKLLSVRAPWHVVVPFARDMAEEFKTLPNRHRLRRDYAKILAVTKGAALLRFHRRRTDGRGRLVAELQDYAEAFRLLGPSFAATTGVKPGIREVVESVGRLFIAQKAAVSVTAVAADLGLDRSVVSRRAKDAVRADWLIDERDKTERGRPARLKPGELLPQDEGLPTVEALRARMAASRGEVDARADVTPDESEGNRVQVPFARASTDTHAEHAEGCACSACIPVNPRANGTCTRSDVEGEGVSSPRARDGGSRAEEVRTDGACPPGWTSEVWE